MAHFYGVNATHNGYDWHGIEPRVYNGNTGFGPVGWRQVKGIFVSHVREDASGQGTLIQDWKFLGYFSPPAETPADSTSPRLLMSGDAFYASGPAGYVDNYWHVYGLWNVQYPGPEQFQYNYQVDFHIEGTFEDGSPVYAFTKYGAEGDYTVTGGASSLSSEQWRGHTWAPGRPVPTDNYFRQGSTIRAVFRYSNSRGEAPGYIYTPWITVGPP